MAVCVLVILVERVHDIEQAIVVGGVEKSWARLFIASYSPSEYSLGGDDKLVNDIRKASFMRTIVTPDTTFLVTPL